MGIGEIKREGGDLVVEKSKKRKTSKKTKKPKSVKYNCPKCKDTGVMGMLSKYDVKCTCIVKKEFKRWLNPAIKNSIRSGVGLDLGVISRRWKIEIAKSVLFLGFNNRGFIKYVTKALIRRYYLLGMRTFNYHMITGNEYTEAYVVGEHNKYHKTEYLYLILGMDNYNKTLETTIYALICDRELKGLTTWVQMPSVEVVTASYIDLYGVQLCNYLEEHSNFDLTVIKDGQNIKIKERRN